MFRQRQARPTALAITILATLVWSGNAKSEMEVCSPEFFELTRTVVTPHIQWAVPLAGGPVRVLVIAPRIYQRDTVELAQRLDLDYEYLMLYSAGPDAKPVFGRWDRGLGGNIEGITSQDVLEEFRHKIKQDYDCIVLGGVHKWGDMPEEFLYKLFDKVSKGTGLVLSAEKGHTPDVIAVLRRARPQSDGKRYITAGIPYQGMAVWEKIPSRAALAGALDLRRLNKGRIAILNQLIPHTYSNQITFLSPMPSHERWNEYVERDYYLSLCAKAILWAARREPPLQITALGLAGAQGDAVPQVNPLLSPDAAIHVKTSGAVARAITVTWIIRDTKGNEVATGKGELDRTGKSILPLSGELPAARYFVDCWLKGDGKVVDWGSCLVDVVHHQGISDLAADVVSLEPGKKAKLKFVLRRPAAAATVLRCEVEGPFDRVVTREEIPVTEGATEVWWTYLHRDPVSRIVRITGSLLEGGAIRENRSIEVPVRLPVPVDDFAAVTWQDGKGDHFVNQILRHRTVAMGDNMAFASFMSNVPVWKTARLQAWNNWPIIAYVRNYGYDPGGANSKLVRRPYCLTDPHNKETERRRVHAVVKVLASYGVIYNLGDENTLGNSDICWSPSCLEYFRRYLRRTYGELGKLNAKWNTAFKEWGQVMPLKLAEARSSGQYARWADHRASMDSVWAENFRLGGEYIHELDPKARWGFESHGGGEEWYTGFDYTKCFKGATYVAGNVYDYIPDLADPGTYTGGTWYGGTAVEGIRRSANPWWDVARGFRVTHRFADFGAEGDGPYDLFTPDLRPYPGYVAICRETDVVMRGIGKLILLSKRPRPEVASVYSRPSILANGLFFKSLPHTQSRPTMPVPWRHLGYDVLDDGRLLEDDCKVILLGACYAISQKAAATLEVFVKKGGTVIADILPAVLDEHCMPVAGGGLLASLFGVSKQGHVEKMDFGKSGKVTGVPGLPEPLTLRDVTVDPGLKPAGAKIHGDAEGTPICLINEFGAGQAVLLNMHFASLRSEANLASWLSLATRILEPAGVSPPMVVSGIDSYNSPVDDWRPRAMFYEDGPNQYALVIAPVDHFAFARDGHLYLPRSGKYLGKGRSVTLPAGGPRGQLAACLPYRVTAITVKMPEAIQQGERCALLVQIKADGGVQPQRHVIHVGVYDPSGQERRHYRQNAVAPEGRATVEIPFALNEIPGKWKIVLTDVATGTYVERRVGIR